MILFIKITWGRFKKHKSKATQVFLFQRSEVGPEFIFKPPVQVIKIGGLYLINGHMLINTRLDE